MYQFIYSVLNLSVDLIPTSEANTASTQATVHIRQMICDA